jgi:hypothetical protein
LRCGQTLQLVIHATNHERDVGANGVGVAPSGAGAFESACERVGYGDGLRHRETYGGVYTDAARGQLF